MEYAEGKICRPKYCDPRVSYMSCHLQAPGLRSFFSLSHVTTAVNWNQAANFSMQVVPYYVLEFQSKLYPFLPKFLKRNINDHTQLPAI